MIHGNVLEVADYINRRAREAGIAFESRDWRELHELHARVRLRDGSDHDCRAAVDNWLDHHGHELGPEA